MNDRTGQNRVRPNPEASAKFTEASAEASAESLTKNSQKMQIFLRFIKKFGNTILKGVLIEDYQLKFNKLHSIYKLIEIQIVINNW